MSLNMAGTIDGVFRTVNVETRQDIDGSYVDGIFVPGTIEVSTFRNVTIQPLNEDELDMLIRAEQRFTDVRKLYINSGNFDALELNGYVWFLNLKWKIIRADIRPWRRYAKIIVDRYDDQ